MSLPWVLTRKHRLKVLKEEIRKPYFIKLKEFLWEQGVKGPNDTSKSVKVYPARKFRFPTIPVVFAPLNDVAAQNIYSWSNLTPLGRVKVVIIGQDPYHGPNQAHGKPGALPDCVCSHQRVFLQAYVSLCLRVSQSHRPCAM